MFGASNACRLEKKKATGGGGVMGLREGVPLSSSFCLEAMRVAVSLLEVRVQVNHSKDIFNLSTQPAGSFPF